jgi:hypothetical protein
MDGEMHNGKPVLKAEKPTPAQLEAAAKDVEFERRGVELIELKAQFINIEHPKAVERFEKAKATFETLKALADQA